MVPKQTDIRCKHCNSLLAREERDGLCVRRGELLLQCPVFYLSKDRGNILLAV